MKHTLLLFATALLLGIQSYAQTGVAINPTGAEADSCAMLDVSSTTKVCANYSVTIDGVTYGDWYLPSKYELNLLQNKTLVVGFATVTYWSSTEYTVNYAWIQLKSKCVEWLTI